jgi:hypothetical protein
MESFDSEELSLDPDDSSEIASSPLALFCLLLTRFAARLEFGEDLGFSKPID